MVQANPQDEVLGQAVSRGWPLPTALWGSLVVTDRSKCQGDPGPESGDGVSTQHQPLEGSMLCVTRAYVLSEYCSPDLQKRTNRTGPSVPLMVYE